MFVGNSDIEYGDDGELEAILIKGEEDIDMIFQRFEDKQKQRDEENQRRQAYWDLAWQ